MHYPAAEIDSQLKRVAQKLDGSKIAGLALIFSSEEQAWRRNVLPTMTLALNQLPPHEYQRPHAHNAVAVTLCIQGKDCYSIIGGVRKEWQADAVMVTPPGDLHSHHNDGDDWMSCLIVQDGGLHYHLPYNGFSVRRLVRPSLPARPGRCAGERRRAQAAGRTDVRIRG
ncbi:MAG: cupin domain-containing protein [Alphaproteobacteria bacterium]